MLRNRNYILFLIFFMPLTSNLHAQENMSPWLIRARSINVLPNEKSSISIIGGKTTIDNSTVPEFDITYFFTQYVSTELIFSVSNHTVGAVSTSVGDINLGDVWIFPPTLTLQIHPFPNDEFRPFFGAGVNYTVFFGGDAGNVVESTAYKNGFGFALQGGFDFQFNKRWALNFDLKKIFIHTDVTIDAFDSTILAGVDLDPWIIGWGFAFRFEN